MGVGVGGGKSGMGFTAEYAEGAVGEKREEIFSSLSEIFLTRTRDEWFDLLIKADVCAGKVYAMDEVAADPQVLHRQMVLESDDSATDKTRQVGIIPKLSDTPGKVRSAAPVIGEHTRELLLSLGYGESEIEKMHRARVVYLAEMDRDS